MPSFTEVPRNSLVMSLTVPKAVRELGGTAHNDQVTASLNRKSGGAWRYLVNSAVQHGLITYSNWQLATTPFYSNLEEAKGDKGKYMSLLQESFLRPDIYKTLLSKFNSENFKAEEYLVEQGYDINSATIITRNFIEGAKISGLYPSDEQSGLFLSEASKSDYPEQDIPSNKETTMPTEQSHSQSPSAQEPVVTASQRPLPELPPSPPVPKSYFGPVERRVIQIPLPNNRVAELTIPSDLNLKDLNVINMQMEVLKAFIDNS